VALEKWTDALESVHGAIVNKTSALGGGGPAGDPRMMGMGMGVPMEYDVYR
jgi:hypothetical protein